jgi:hypothetical protein
VEVLRNHPPVCPTRPVPCPISYCTTHSNRNFPFRDISAMVERDHDNYIRDWERTKTLITYCRMRVEPGVTQPRTSKSWAVGMDSGDGRFIVEMEYDKARHQWLVGVIAITDGSEYDVAKVQIGQDPWTWDHNVLIGKLNATNTYDERCFHSVGIDDRQGSIGFFECISDVSGDFWEVRVKVSLVRRGQEREEVLGGFYAINCPPFSTNKRMCQHLQGGDDVQSTSTTTMNGEPPAHRQRTDSEVSEEAIVLSD